MSDVPEDLPDEQMDWDRVAELQARYEAAFSVWGRRRLRYLESRIQALEALAAEPPQPNGRGAYM